jgi:hypothetical protein
MPPPTSTRPPLVIVGDLVRGLLEAKEHEIDAERAVTDTIAALFDDWHPRFPTSLGWHWTPADPSKVGRAEHRIDIYEADDSPAAAAALHLAGFPVVVIHGHPAHLYPTCACVRRLAGQS